MRTLLLSVLPLCLLAADAPDDDAKEYARFEGTWKVVSVEVDGKKLPKETFKDWRLILRGQRWTLKEGDTTSTGPFKVDVSKKPRHIDVTFTEGPDKVKTMLGVYELDGDTYRVCLAPAGKARPKGLVSKPGSGHIFEILKREKAGPEKKKAAQKPEEDYTNGDPHKLGIHLVKPTKDPATGFVVGSRNATGLVLKLPEINGRSIADLKRDMRPGRLSSAGFLGKTEKLLEILAADNRYVVDDLGLTHQELARHLHLAGAVAVQQGQRAIPECH